MSITGENGQRGAADARRFFPWGTGNPTFYLVVTAIAAAIGVGAAASLGDPAIAIVTGLASFLVGGILGFIFGIPRYATAESAGAYREASVPEAMRYRANTNLEQVSDWLTKIIVGLGLTQFPSIISRIDDWAKTVGAALTGVATTTSHVAGAALLVSSALSGFVFLYLWSRVYLARMFQRAEGEG